ncbi:unnamed protein product, partial [Iphiclides podalirius]
MLHQWCSSTESRRINKETDQTQYQHYFSTVAQCPTPFHLLRTSDAFVKKDKESIEHGVMAIQNGGDIFGVSSMASVTSNNGKMSSVGGVKFYTPPGASINKNGDTMTFKYPIDGNRGIATGFVQMRPGTVIASSSTYNTGMPERIDWGLKNPAYDIMRNWPTLNDFVFQPQIDIFEQPTYIDPWFTKHAIDSYAPPKPDLRNGFPYPNIDPFLNLWR